MRWAAPPTTSSRRPTTWPSPPAMPWSPRPTRCGRRSTTSSPRSATCRPGTARPARAWSPSGRPSSRWWPPWTASARSCRPGAREAWAQPRSRVPVTAPPGRSDQLESLGAADRRRPVGHVELAVDGTHVGLEGVDRDVELRGHLPVRQAEREHPQDRELPGGELLDRRDLLRGRGVGELLAGERGDAAERPIARLERQFREPAADRGPSSKNV